MTHPSIPFESTDAPTKYAGFFGFRVGTCEGLWRATPDAFEILAVVNRERGNGHFAQAMKWFELSAIREKKKIRLLQTFNFKLYWQSIRKHGYRRKKGTLFTLEKSFV